MQRTEMLLHAECNLERTIVEELKQGISCLRMTPEQIYASVSTGSQNEKWRFESFDALDNPAVVSFKPSRPFGSPFSITPAHP